MLFNDTIGIKLDLDICNKLGTSVTLDITERKHSISYPISSVHAGEEKNVPIPGLSIIVPYVGNFGVDATILIAGNPDELLMKVGLNACLQMNGNIVPMPGHHHSHKLRELCASSVPGLKKEFPWYILKGKYSFGNVCEEEDGNDGNDGNDGKNGKDGRDDGSDVLNNDDNVLSEKNKKNDVDMKIE